MLRLALLYLALINAATYVVFWFDKRRAAGGRRRVSERELLYWVAAGGAPAALLAMRRLRHKTRKWSFRFAVYGIVLLQMALLLFLLRT
ncbi:MAG: DUF1294 domain-containing protein [Planctomycetaceae bacterium]